MKMELAKRLMVPILLACTATASAEIYQWTDAEGHVHFGDKAAKAGHAGQAEQLAIEERPGRLDPDAERNRQQLRELHQQYDAERAVEAGNLVAMRSQFQQRQAYCKCLQNNIRSERGAGFMFSYDENGKRVLWTAEQRETYREQLQAANRQYCAAD